MEENKLTHRAGLVREAAEILNRYTPYAAERRVTFQTAENGWLTARLERTDGQPLAQSAHPSFSPWPKVPGRNPTPTTSPR